MKNENKLIYRYGNKLKERERDNEAKLKMNKNKKTKLTRKKGWRRLSAGLITLVGSPSPCQLELDPWNHDERSEWPPESCLPFLHSYCGIHEPMPIYAHHIHTIK